MNDLGVGYEAADDNDLPISIQHHREKILIDGKLVQDYRFLIYRFQASPSKIQARTYLDDASEISITEPIEILALPADIMAYLQKRFRLIKQLGGPDGYRMIWEESALTKD
jgi:hypothetical protein